MRKIKKSSSKIIEGKIPNLKGGFVEVKEKGTLVTKRSSKLTSLYVGKNIKVFKDPQGEETVCLSEGGKLFREHSLISNIRYLLIAVTAHEVLLTGCDVQDAIDKYLFWLKGDELKEDSLTTITSCIDICRKEIKNNPLEAILTTYNTASYFILSADRLINPLLNFIRDNNYEIYSDMISCTVTDLDAETKRMIAYMNNSVKSHKKNFPLDMKVLVYPQHIIHIIHDHAIQLGMESPVSLMMEAMNNYITETVGYFSDASKHYVDNILSPDYRRIRLYVLHLLTEDVYEKYEDLGISDDMINYDLLNEMENFFALKYNLVKHKWNKRKTNKYRNKPNKEIFKIAGLLQDEADKSLREKVRHEIQTLKDNI